MLSRRCGCPGFSTDGWPAGRHPQLYLFILLKVLGVLRFLIPFGDFTYVIDRKIWGHLSTNPTHAQAKRKAGKPRAMLRLSQNLPVLDFERVDGMGMH